MSSRTRIVEAAIALTVRDGWSAVTMARLAEAAGVSRQTVYNEVGTRSRLADAMVLHELAGFLAVVEAAFDAHPGDAPASVQAATAAVLRRAQRNALLRAVVAAEQGADTELVPLLSTQSGGVLEAARQVVDARLAPCTPQVPAERRAAATDMIVRTVLSHVMQPGGSPRVVGASVGAAAALLLRAG